MDILIRGAGFDNKGAEAMLRTVQREVGRRIPNACFHILVSPLEVQFANISGFSPTLRSSNLEGMLGLSPLVLGRRALAFLHNPDFRRAMMVSSGAAREILMVKAVDAVIDISGYAYGDAWDVNYCKDAQAWVDYCKNHGKPYIFLPQAWGPFEKKDIAKWTRGLCEDASLLFARDQESFNHLSSLFDNPSEPDKIHMAPDIVFRFQGEHLNVGASILRDMGYEFGTKPLIGMVPNMHVYRRTQGVDSDNRYIQLLVETANYCIDNLNAAVLLLPNVIKVPGKTDRDDRFLCGIIEPLIRKSKDCFTILDYHRSETIKSILSHLDLLISSRFHSLVFALSAEIPVIALGWSHKYLELLTSFGLGEYACKHDQMDQTVVIDILKHAWEKRKSDKHRIAEILPAIQRDVDVTFDLVTEVIKSS